MTVRSGSAWGWYWGRFKREVVYGKGTTAGTETETSKTKEGAEGEAARGQVDKAQLAKEIRGRNTKACNQK
jgi:hypothetical protein